MSMFDLAKSYLDRQNALNNPTDNNEKVVFLNGVIPNRYSSRDVVSFDTTDVGYRNRGDYSPIHSNSTLTLFHPLKKYTGNEDANTFIGIRNGKLLAGNKSIFKNGDLVSPTFSNTIKGFLKKNNIIQSELGRNKDNPNKYVPLVEMSNGGTGSMNVLMQNKFALDKYGGIQGGSALLQVGDKFVSVSGGVRDIDNAIEKLKAETGSDTVKVYSVDNGSYSNGLKKNGQISSNDLRNYDNLNVAGGNYIYTKKSANELNKKSFRDLILESSRKHGLRIGEFDRSIDSALDNYHKGTSKTLLSQHLTGNAVDFINPTNAQMDSVLSDVRKVYPNAEHGRNWTEIYDPYHLQSNDKISIKDNIKTLQNEYIVAKSKYGKEEADKMFSSYVNTKSLPLNKQLAYAFGYPDNIVDKVKSGGSMLSSKIEETGNAIKPIIDRISSFDGFDIKALIHTIRGDKYKNNTVGSKPNAYKHPLFGDTATEELQLANPVPISSNTYSQSSMPMAPEFEPNQKVSFSGKATSFLDKLFNEAKSQTLRSQIKVPLSKEADISLPEIAGYLSIAKSNYNNNMPIAPQFNGKVNSSPSLKWRESATNWINKQAGTTISTDDRIMIGKRLFGDDYRGTLEQNKGIIKEIRDYTGADNNRYNTSNLFGK